MVPHSGLNLHFSDEHFLCAYWPFVYLFCKLSVWIVFSFFYWSFGSLSIFKNSSRILLLCDTCFEYLLRCRQMSFDCFLMAFVIYIF